MAKPGSPLPTAPRPRWASWTDNWSSPKKAMPSRRSTWTTGAPYRARPRWWPTSRRTSTRRSAWPCSAALDGPFLFTANSPSHSVSRYAVYGKKIIQDAAVVATFDGAPTDIAYGDGLAAVVDANGAVSHVSIFNVDGDGDFNLKSSV